MPLIPRLGFGFLAAVLVLVVILVVRHKPSNPAPGKRPQHPAPTSPTEPGGRRESTPTPADQASATRTIMTSADAKPTVAAERISERRARHHEPTVELRFDPFEDSDDPANRRAADRRTDGGRTERGAGGSQSAEQAAGRWWSGQPDDDETVEDEQPWAAEPTVERRPNPFRRHGPDPD